MNWSQIVTSCFKTLKHSSVLPDCFTEQGVAMLASILRSETAIKINIAIVRAFVAIRQIALNQPAEPLSVRMNKMEECLNDILADQNEINEDTRMQLELINETLANMQSNKTKPMKRSRIHSL